MNFTFSVFVIPTLGNFCNAHDKTFIVIKKARHYYDGQPNLLLQATSNILQWLEERNLIEISLPSNQVAKSFAKNKLDEFVRCNSKQSNKFSAPQI